MTVFSKLAILGVIILLSKNFTVRTRKYYLHDTYQQDDRDSVLKTGHLLGSNTVQQMIESTKKLGENEDSETWKNFSQIANLLVRNGVLLHL